MLQTKPINFQTKLDSLNNSQHALQIKVDSLNKIVNETRIAHGFFSDVISQDLYMFSTIVVVAGLVSWAFFAGVLALHKRAVERNMNNLFKNEIKIIEERIQKIERSYRRTKIDVDRSMYFVNLNHNRYPECFIWTTIVLMDLANYYKYTKDPNILAKIELWLGNADFCLNKCEVGNAHLLERTKAYHRRIDFLIEQIEGNFHEKISKIDKRFKHLVYTDLNNDNS